MVATRSDDKTVRLWDVAAATEIGVLQVPDVALGDVAFSPDSRTIVTAGSVLMQQVPGEDGKAAVKENYEDIARLWDTTTGQQIGTLQGHEGWVRTAGFSPDGKTILTASSDSTARLWEWPCENSPQPGKTHELARVAPHLHARSVAMSGVTPSIEIIRFRL